MRLRTILPVILLMGVFLIYTLATLRSTAPTSDELPHLASGYTAIRFGDRSLNAEHPPLAKMLAAAPLLFFVTPPKEWFVKDWNTQNEWDFGREFLYHNGKDSQMVMNIGRIPMILMGVLLCTSVYLWSYRLFGAKGAFWSLYLCVFCPNILAHTRLVTTDVPLAAFGLLTAFLLWRVVLKPSFCLAALLGIALGCMLAVKYSAIVLLGGMMLAVFSALFFCFEEFDQRFRKFSFLTGIFMLVVVFAAFVLAISYGTPFFWSRYIEGVRSVGFNHNPDFRYYLFGNFQKGGFAWYFPAAFLVKSSPAVLGLVVISGLLCCSKRTRKFFESGNTSRLGWFLLVIPSICYLFFVIRHAPNIRYRYLIPLLPFIYVAGGFLPRCLWNHLTGRVLLSALCLVHFYAAWKAYPDPISYFNGIAACSGPEAIRCLDDSNIDWGQNVIQLSEMLPKDQEISILYFGSAELGEYFSKWRRMEQNEMSEPQKKIYAMSIHGLNRWNHFLARPKGVDWFRQFTPKMIVGNTYYIYDFRESM